MFCQSAGRDGCAWIRLVAQSVELATSPAHVHISPFLPTGEFRNPARCWGQFEEVHALWPSQNLSDTFLQSTCWSVCSRYPSYTQCELTTLSESNAKSKTSREKPAREIFCDHCSTGAEEASYSDSTLPQWKLVILNVLKSWLLALVTAYKLAAAVAPGVSLSFLWRTDRTQLQRDSCADVPKHLWRCRLETGWNRDGHGLNWNHLKFTFKSEIILRFLQLPHLMLLIKRCQNHGCKWDWDGLRTLWQCLMPAPGVMKMCYRML